MLLLIILLPLLAGTLLTGWSGAQPSKNHRVRTAWLAAAVTAASLALLLVRAPAVMRGKVIHDFIPWVPEIGLNLGMRLDGLSLMFALLITGIGVPVIRSPQLTSMSSRMRSNSALLVASLIVGTPAHPNADPRPVVKQMICAPPAACPVADTGS